MTDNDVQFFDLDNPPPWAQEDTEDEKEGDGEEGDDTE